MNINFKKDKFEFNLSMNETSLERLILLGALIFIHTRKNIR